MVSKVYDLTLHPIGVSTAEFLRFRDGLSGELRIAEFRGIKPGDFIAIFDRRDSAAIVLKRVRGVIPIMDREGMVLLRFKLARSSVIRCGDRGIYGFLEDAAG